MYGGDPDNVEAAKNEYNTQMAQCHESDADERVSPPPPPPPSRVFGASADVDACTQYNTCLNEYATIFAAEFTPGPAECTGCA